MLVEVAVSPTCPHGDATIALVRQVVEALRADATVRVVDITETPSRSRGDFPGSPTVRIDGKDIAPRMATVDATGCRVYDGGTPIPPRWLIEAGIMRAMGLRGFLFLCVANSARSQIAEGVARKLAPESVQVWSAGSRPTSVRPEAVAVLQEVGIDIRHHRSKHVSEIDPTLVDAVITLCAEEECPVFLGDALRVHWEMPDPARAEGSAEERLKAFRTVRDELHHRLSVLFVDS